jgi:hypothetical protein
MTSLDILAKLFGSINRVKLIRLFLMNPDEVFPASDVYRRAKISKQAGRKEIALLKTIGFIKSQNKAFVLPRGGSKSGKSKKKKNKRKKIRGWKLSESFSLMLGLKNFILDTAPLSRDQLLKKLQRAGRIKLVILSGVFGESGPSRADILVVGDAVRKGALERAIRDIEAEVGKELTYASFKTEDFLYRLGMYDKFIRDILDYPHEKILDKIGV